jgi:tRNA A-37 threonylcarbamoyl transferase component Bud32
LTGNNATQSNTTSRGNQKAGKTVKNNVPPGTATNQSTVPTPVSAATAATKTSQDDPKKRIVTLEPSVRSFSGPSSTRRDRSESVQVTDALLDVRLKYHIDNQELGHGHYGVVRKCMNRETEDWYAIKSIRKAKVSKIEVLKREIEILKEVKHPNIIELIDIFEDDKYLHLVTDLCTGGELFDRIIAKTQSAEGHYSEHDAAALVRDILDAIAYCHSKGIVHRDLKPENFLFATKDDASPIKIIDFGLSRHNDTNQGIMKTKVGTFTVRMTTRLYSTRLDSTRHASTLHGVGTKFLCC